MKHEWREKTEEGETRLVTAIRHGRNWRLQSRLKRENEWTQFSQPEIELEDLESLLDVLQRKYQRNRVPHEHIKEIEKLISAVERKQALIEARRQQSRLLQEGRPSVDQSTDAFLASKTYAVAGASTKPEKYGNKVFHALLKSDRETYPLNPAADQIDGHQAYPSIGDLPIVPEAISVITPPSVTRQIVADAIAAGVKHIWMQPGAEDAEASQSARAAGLNVIDDGSCILVVLASTQ
jgi:predicted CoA-binding protein